MKKWIDRNFCYEPIDKTLVKRWIEYVTEGNLFKRFNQCFTCKELDACERGDEAEGESGMCRYYKPLRKE